MSAITLPKTKVEVVLKDKLTRKEFREYNAVLFEGAKSTDSGVFDQASILNNIETQKDKLVLLYVSLYDGKKITQDVLDAMDVADYEFVLAKCQKHYKDHTEKKS